MSRQAFLSNLGRTLANTSAREIIKREYGEYSRNLITPRIISYGKIMPGIAYEISEGTDFNHNRIWGVSIAQLMADGTTIRRTDLSCLIREYQQVREYVWKLKGNKATQGEKLFEPQTVRGPKCK